MIIAMRSRAEEVCRAELERFRSRLDELEPAHLDVIEGVTRGILAKLLREPTVALKDAAGTPRGARLVAALRDLFALEREAQGGPTPRDPSTEKQRRRRERKRVGEGTR